MRQVVTRNIEHHSNWTKSLGVLARLVRSFSGFNPTLSDAERRSTISKHPDTRELDMARKLQMLYSQDESIKALKEGRLTSLGGRIKGGLVVVSGRVPEEDLGKILGKPYLPVIWASTRLARLIVRHCHQEDHRLSPSGQGQGDWCGSHGAMLLPSLRQGTACTAGEEESPWSSRLWAHYL